MSIYKQIKINLKPDDYEQLKNHADNINITLASFVRKSINLELENSPKPRKKSNNIFIQEDPRKLRFLAYLSNNMNQIARKVNTDKEVDTLILYLLQEISDEIKDFADISDKGSNNDN